MTPRRRDVVTSPRQRSTSAPKATADTTISYTVRFDVRESLDVDRLIIGMKHETSRRTLDKSEIIRTLLRLAGEDPAVRAALLRELTTS